MTRHCRLRVQAFESAVSVGEAEFDETVQHGRQARLAWSGFIDGYIDVFTRSHNPCRTNGE